MNGTTKIDRGVPLPASNLNIQLELVSWKSVVDITGDKKVVKKIVKSGEGFDHPNEGSLVKGIVSHEPYTFCIFYFCHLPNSANKSYSIDLILLLSVIYIGKLEDGSVFETKGSEEEPYAFVCLEGT